MKLKIRLINGEVIDQSIQDSSFVIGRSRKCQVIIPHEGVSRQHVQIDLLNGDVFVTDLGSTNGVLIDGEKIPANEKTLFQTYRMLSFGAVESLQIEFETSEASRIMTNPLGKYSVQKETTTVHNAGTAEEFTSVTKVAPAPMRKQMLASAAKKKQNLKSKKESKENFRMIAVNFIVIGLLLAVGYYFFNREKEAPPIENTKKTKGANEQYL